jgi:solute carrier family 32 (vesicular inhibitory amino acid transporter)
MVKISNKGHAVFPSLYTNMKKPQRYTESLVVTYSIVFLFYSLIGTMGYLMFGSSIMAEVVDIH